MKLFYIFLHITVVFELQTALMLRCDEDIQHYSLLSLLLILECILKMNFLTLNIST